MAKLILLVTLLSILSACSQNQTKQVQNTLKLQIEADNYYAQGNCQQALVLYRELVETVSNDSKSLLRIGNCHAKSEDYAAAELAYQQALSRDIHFSKAWYNLAYIRAKVLAKTVADMHDNVDPNSVEASKIRSLAVEVLKPFNLQIESK
ncbi:hypothetical protein A9Q78_11480 [Methylophaga sp. 41_12_T18]|nr:hypothetical protein A9Q78_11480 [Methylophaga sp. 41_12_T18]